MPQPSTAGVGINPAKSWASAARFFWYAADPDKNQVTGAASTSGLKGTATTGPDGALRNMNAANTGAMTWAMAASTPASSGYMVALRIARNNTAGDFAWVAGFFGGALRVETWRGGGGGGEIIIHHATVNNSGPITLPAETIDSAGLTYVATYSGSGGSPANELREYVKTGAGTVIATRVTTLSSPIAGGTTAQIGHADKPGQGMYGALYVATNPGDAEAQAIRDDFWSFVASSDTTAPVLTSPTGTATGSTTATVGATTDEANGTMYAVVTTSATQPTVAQIKAGQNNGGTAAAWAGSQSITSTGANTFSATGLTASTTYFAHVVHTDAAANDSNRVTSASFTTSAAPAVPGAPGGLVSITTPTATATVTIGAASGATSYEARINDGLGGAMPGTWTAFGTTTTTWAGIVLGRTYAIDYRGVNGTGAGATASGTFRVEQGAPSTPSGTFVAALLAALNP